MSALEFHKASGGRCSGDKCTRAGRYKMTIAGYPVQAQYSYAGISTSEVICGHCKNAAQKAWDGALEDAEAVAA